MPWGGTRTPRRHKGDVSPLVLEHGMHALRHFYASVLLDAGESIKAVSEYLGHSDPGLTLKVYAHLRPSSREPGPEVTRAGTAAAGGFTPLRSHNGPRS